MGAMDLAIHKKLTPRRLTRHCPEGADRIHQRKHYPPLDMRIPIGIGAASGGLGLSAAAPFRQQRGPRRHETLAGFLFIAPWLAGFMLLTAGPVVASILLSFCEYDVLHPVAWAGLDNYRALPRDPLFWKSLANTLFMVLGVPLGMAVSLGVAMLLNARVKGMAFYRTIYYLPAIVPAVASSILIWVLNPQSGWCRPAAPLRHRGPQRCERVFRSPILLWPVGSGAGMIIQLAGLKDSETPTRRLRSMAGRRRFRHVTPRCSRPTSSSTDHAHGTFQIYAGLHHDEWRPGRLHAFYVYCLFNNAFRYFKWAAPGAPPDPLPIILALTLSSAAGKRWFTMREKRGEEGAGLRCEPVSPGTRRRRPSGCGRQYPLVLLVGAPSSFLSGWSRPH